jgi:hypothetical protein
MKVIIIQVRFLLYFFLFSLVLEAQTWNVNSDTAGLKFKADSSFIGVNASSWGNNIGNLTLTLYKWKTDYAATVNGTPIADSTFINFNDNARLRLNFKPQPSGEYYWELSNAVEVVGIWKWNNIKDSVTNYFNGKVVTDGNYESKIYYADGISKNLTNDDGKGHTPVQILPGINTTIGHIRSKDIGLINSAFTYGYTDNIVNVEVHGKKIQTLAIQRTSRTSYSVWTRDLYWGFLGWAQAGDDSVLQMMKSSLQFLVMVKNKNQAVGQSKIWPLNDKRFYIAEAYFVNPKIGVKLEKKEDMENWPWNSEAQADFLLLSYNYWELSGNRKFIESIWDDIRYVTKTLELLDTNGNSLPDALQGSYDYQWIDIGEEEPLMSAITSKAYSSVAKLARMLNKDEYADSLENLAVKVKKTMNKSVKDGGLWNAAGGYYVIRKITKGKKQILDKFIPYENLVPMWFRMTNSEQDSAIFAKLDAGFKEYYDLLYGPEYIAPAAHGRVDYSSAPWLGFLDVYLRGKKEHYKNRSEIFHLLIQHAYDAGGMPFPEGGGINGFLTGHAGRTWDNGNFFQMLVSGIYGLEKSKDGIKITAPEKINGVPLTEMKNFQWRKAIYNFKWTGEGKQIKSITVDGNEITREPGVYKLTGKTGDHNVEIHLYSARSGTSKS